MKNISKIDSQVPAHAHQGFSVNFSFFVDLRSLMCPLSSVTVCFLKKIPQSAEKCHSHQLFMKIGKTIKEWSNDFEIWYMITPRYEKQNRDTKIEKYLLLN